MKFEEIIKNQRIAVFAAHCDDIELAMGGTLNKLKNNRVWIDVFSDATNVRGNETIMDEFWSSMKIYGLTLQTTLWSDVNTMEFYSREKDIKSRMFYCKTHFRPDIVICCNPKSDNRDHSIVGECALNVFQEQTVLLYEDIRGGREHRSDIYVILNAEDVNKKLRAARCYVTQSKRSYFKPDALVSFLRMRGSQIGVTFAESLEVARLVV